MRLSNTLHAFGTEAFAAVLEQEFADLGDDSPLPRLLQGATNEGGMVDPASIRLSVGSTSKEPDGLLIRLDVFFTEIVGGCSCGDEPYQAQCMAALRIKITEPDAAVSIRLVEE